MARPRAEIAGLDKEIYDRDIRSKIEDGHRGDVVAIDVDTGNWAIGDNVTRPRTACGRSAQCGQRLERTGGVSYATARRGPSPEERPVIEGVISLAYGQTRPSQATLPLGGPYGGDLEGIASARVRTFRFAACLS